MADTTPAGLETAQQVSTPMTTVEGLDVDQTTVHPERIAIQADTPGAENNVDAPRNEFFTRSSNVNVSGGTMISAQSVTIFQGQSSQTHASIRPQRTEEIMQEERYMEARPSHPILNRAPHSRSKKSCHVYWRNLIVKERGSPLWHPEPNSYPGIYKRRGVSIGDVGLLLPSGSFHFLFNICHSRDHPINAGGVPEGFIPIDPPISDINIETQYVKEENSWYASQYIMASREEANGELLFESSAEEGAILTLPYGTRSEDLIAVRGLRKYIGKDIQRWYRYVAIDRQIEVDNGDIRLVTGWDKTSRWGVAAFCSSSNSVRLTFHPTEGLARSYRWQHSGSLDSRTGPSDDTNIGTAMQGESPTTDNQCVFVRTLNATFRNDFWAALNESSFVTVDDNSGPLEFADDQHRPPMSIISTQCATEYQGRGKGQSGGSHTTSYQSSTETSRSMMPHPSAKINDLLWKLVPPWIKSTTTVMGSHDTDWISVIQDSDSVLPEPYELYSRILALNASVILEDGVLSLHSPPGQPSNVSDSDSPLRASEKAKSKGSKFRVQRSKLINTHVNNPSISPPLTSSPSPEPQQQDTRPQQLSARRQPYPSPTRQAYFLSHRPPQYTSIVACNSSPSILRPYRNATPIDEEPTPQHRSSVQDEEEEEEEQTAITVSSESSTDEEERERRREAERRAKAKKTTKKKTEVANPPVSPPLTSSPSPEPQQQAAPPSQPSVEEQLLAHLARLGLNPTTGQPYSSPPSQPAQYNAAFGSPPPHAPYNAPSLQPTVYNPQHPQQYFNTAQGGYYTPPHPTPPPTSPYNPPPTLPPHGWGTPYWNATPMFSPQTFSPPPGSINANVGNVISTNISNVANENRRNIYPERKTAD